MAAMTTANRQTVREMVQEAVDALGGDTTNVAIRDWILKHYPGTNPATIMAHITMMTVNHDSRVHFPQNRRPRPANDPRYDVLFGPGRGRVQRYEPARNGVWAIVEHE